MILYILAICLAAMRFYTSFFYFFIAVRYELFGLELTPILKLNLGLVQCWILFELGLKVTINIRMTESLKQSIVGQEEQEVAQPQFESNGIQNINNLIKYGRCFMMVAIPIEFVSFMIYFGIVEAKLN